MAYTTIDDPTAYFQTKIYTGNGSTQDITFDGNSNLQPDFLWLKGRSLAEGHTLQNSVSGVTKHLHSQNTDAEVTDTGIVTAFNSNGFSLGDEGDVNGNTSTFVGWGWKAGTSFTNDASATGIGTIDSTGSVSDASGFSIVSYTGTGSAGTIKHGLSAAPNFMIVKNRDAARSWNVYFGDPTDYIYLNDTAAAADYNEIWNDTAPTTSVFSVGTDNGVNQSGEKYIAYIFAEKKGYSKFGSYTGNGNADGPMIFTGFSPSFVMTKNTETASQWTMWDNKRSAFNLTDKVLYANGSNAEATATTESVDFTAQGFKIRGSNSGINTSGEKYIYMSFASSPFTTSTGIPTTAR